MVSAISTLVGEKLEDVLWFSVTMHGVDGSIYGIPVFPAPGRGGVIKFNFLDKSVTRIGPDIGADLWFSGATTDSGVIYFLPSYLCNRGILKIDTNTDTVTELDGNLLPERSYYDMMSCALGLDGCIYSIPYNPNQIMKLDPNNGDEKTSAVAGWISLKYRGTVVGIDGCVYGMPWNSSLILKYDPINDIISYIGEEGNEHLKCIENGVLGRDGCIYAATNSGRVLKINTTNNAYCIVGHAFWSDYDQTACGNGILGIDGCIYWPPYDTAQVLKYDPHSNLTSLVGDDFGTCKTKWRGGCAAPDGVIYCLPCSANRILAIDPLKEYALSLKNNMEEHPEQLGRIFHPSDDIPDDTNFDRAVNKFGQKKILELLDDCMSLVHQSCTISNLHPFMIAASCKRSHVSVIYHLIRQMPSFAHCANRFSIV